MTSRHTRDEPRWGWAPVVAPGYDRVGTAGHSTASAPVPETRDLPPNLDDALRLLVEGAHGTVGFTVRPDPEAVTAARHFATTQLGDWNMSALCDDVALVVTELVTNALRHSVPAHPHLMPSGAFYPEPPTYPQVVSRPEAPAYPEAASEGVIRLRLLHRRVEQADWVLCGILDGGREAPRRKEPDYIAETGRGLHLVDSFTDRWGWRGLPMGKIVWALFQGA
ncbi:ATP-binding protein [Thermomonospora umbrina]|nr:ATP-binding protein [Thermomonospora umbrina]